MNRYSHGVNPQSILDSVKSPKKVLYDSERGTYKYVGRNAIVVLNENGKVVTTWAKNRNGYRR